MLQGKRYIYRVNFDQEKVAEGNFLKEMLHLQVTRMAVLGRMCQVNTKVKVTSFYILQMHNQIKSLIVHYHHFVFHILPRQSI